MKKNDFSPFFKFDVLEWIEGRIELLDPEAKNRGVFVGLCARIWRNNGSVKNDEFLPSLLRVEKATLSVALEFLKKNDFIIEKDGFLSVKFITSQLTERFLYFEKQRNNGACGGRPRKPTQNPKKPIIERKSIKEDTIVSKKNAASGNDNNAAKTAVSEQLTELRIAEKLASAYPKKFGINAGKRAALNVIREMFDKGISYDQIEIDLLDDVKAYADAVSGWPDAQKRFIWSMETFFKDGHYDDDSETWIRSEDTTTGQDDTPEVFLRLDARK